MCTRDALRRISASSLIHGAILGHTPRFAVQISEYKTGPG